MLQTHLPVWMNFLIGGIWTWLVLGFCLFGCNSYWMVLRTLGQRNRLSISELPELENWPLVTVQIPLYNELALAGRIIDACAVLDYPLDKLEIQVLDDSQDETRQLARARVLYWGSQGVDIRYMHRSVRSEYKAGALKWGMEQGKGKYFAIFDADFQPEPGFLRKTVGHLSKAENSHVGFLQTRWHVVNSRASHIAKSMSLAINGHFAVEVMARKLAGLWFGFNGSAGVWRRECIEDPNVGGWSGSTLCEDLHLSYLAQLAGWQGDYLKEVAVRSDAPVKLAELRLQQFRWAKGSVQVLTRLLPTLFLVKKISLGQRLQAFLHIGSYLQQSMMLGLFILSLPMTMLQIEPPSWSTFAMVLGIGPIVAVGVGHCRLHPKNWWRNLPTLVTLSLVGIGSCLTSSIAVSEALRGKLSPFQRTPKGTLSGKKESPYSWDTRPLENRILPWEGILVFYCLLAMFLSLAKPVMGVWPISLIGLCSIGLVAMWSLWERLYRPGCLAARDSRIGITFAKRIHTYTGRFYGQKIR